jgi:long-chain acyl-CoA synthetase
VWEKVKAAIESRLDPAARRAVDVGLSRVRADQAANRGDGPGPDKRLLADAAEADGAVLSVLRRQLGLDQVRRSFTGAAPSTVDLLEFFGAIGLTRAGS